MIGAEIFDVLVVAAISGPVNVYVGFPAPPVEVAVNVMIPPVQNGLLAEETNDDTDGSAVSVYVALTVEEAIQPVPE